MLKIRPNEHTFLCFPLPFNLFKIMASKTTRSVKCFYFGAINARIEIKVNILWCFNSLKHDCVNLAPPTFTSLNPQTSHLNSKFLTYFVLYFKFWYKNSYFLLLPITGHLIKPSSIIHERFQTKGRFIQWLIEITIKH